MKRKLVLFAAAIIVALSGWHLMPTMLSEAAPAVNFLYYPKYIMSQAAANNEAPFPVYLQINGLNAATHSCVQVEWAVSTSEGGSRYDYGTQSWIAATGYIDFGTGNTQITTWIYLRNTAQTGNLGTPGNTGNIRVRIKELASSCTGGTGTVFDSPANEITVIDSATACTSSCGGWVSENASIAAAGDMMVVRSGATILGMYRASTGSGIKNGSWPGYPANTGAGTFSDGYYKIAVPACAAGTCNYSIERWDYAAPTGSARPNTQINTMTGSGADNTVAAGQTTILNFTAPTAIALQQIKVSTTATVSTIFIVLSGAAALSAAILLRRRSRAA